MKTIIVTGASGFIGSHICEFLLTNYSDYQIIGIDDLSGSDYSNISHLIQKGFIFHKIDLRDEKAVEVFFDGNNFGELYVFYLASAAHENRSFFTPNENMSRNDQAYRIFLTQAIKNNLKKVVMFSSMARYGHGEGFTPPFSEEVPANPADPYAVSKVAMEQFTSCMSDVFGFEYCILVPHNVFGEKQYYCDPYRNVLAIWMNLILQNKQPVIYGDGCQTRAFSYIHNNLGPMVSSLFKDTHKMIINIGSEKEYSLKEAWEIVQEISGTNLNAKYLEARPGEVKHAYCTVQKSQKVLGYQDTFTFENGVELMWKWIKDLGPREFIFIDKLELTNDHIPKPWLENF